MWFVSADAGIACADGDLTAVRFPDGSWNVYRGPELVETVDELVGYRLSVHEPEACRGGHCPVHEPSPHHMRLWPRNWRNDRYLMERMCAHGIGHPDPDHLAHIASVRGVKAARDDSIHGCDGCCTARAQ